MARILFIEDEAPLMDGLINCLKRAGHEVESILTAADGLNRLEQNRNGYDVVLLDLRLPQGEPPTFRGKSIPAIGPEEPGEFVLAQVAESWPGLPVIVLTAIRSSLNGLQHPTKCTLLRKPVMIGGLLQEIDEILGADPRR